MKGKFWIPTFVFVFLSHSVFVWGGSSANKGGDFLEKIQIKVGNQVLRVEVAKTPKERNRGLMFRKKLPEGTGMLFVFEREHRLSFWMKNTFLPLDIGFFDKNRRLINVHQMKPVESEMVRNPKGYESSQPGKYALEVPVGWFAKHKIKPGQRFEFLQKRK